MPLLPTRPTPPRPPWRPLLRTLAGGVVLAGTLATLAGGAAVPAQHSGDAAGQAANPPLAAATATATVQPGQPGPPRPAVSAASTTAASTAPVTTAEPAPYAPGGDDVLPSSAAPPALARATTAGLPTAAAPAPLLWLRRSTVGLGETAVLHLATADGLGHCRGAGVLAGQPASHHTITWRATAAGRHSLAVVCDGPGGPVGAAVVLTVPLPVAPTSQHNQQALDPGTTPLPSLRQLGLQPSPSRAGITTPNASLITSGDFLQQGRQSLFVVAAGPGGAAQAHVMAPDAAGRWADSAADPTTDHTADLLDADQRAICPSATQTLSADFNRDGRPDVWVVCTGRQLLFLSQADGRYRRLETPFALQASQAEARDVDGDGWPDIITLASLNGTPRTLLLLGRGDGRFEPGPAAAWGLVLAGVSAGISAEISAGTR